MSRSRKGPPGSKPRKRKPKLFLSYRRSDAADISGRVYDGLSREHGKKRVIKDVNSFPPGVDFKEYIEDIIPSCTAVLVIISPHWTQTRGGSPRTRKGFDDYVHLEIRCALEHGVPVIPVLVGGARLPDPKRLPSDVRPILRRHAIALRSDPDFETDLARLMAHL